MNKSSCKVDGLRVCMDVRFQAFLCTGPVTHTSTCTLKASMHVNVEYKGFIEFLISKDLYFFLLLMSCCTVISQLIRITCKRSDGVCSTQEVRDLTA